VTLRSCAPIVLAAAAPNCHSEPACAGKRSENLLFLSSSNHSSRRAWGHAIFALFFALGIAALSSLAQTSPAFFPGPRASKCTADFISKTGDFGSQAETDVIILLERSRHLSARLAAGIEHLLNPLAFSKEREQTSFTYASNEADPGCWPSSSARRSQSGNLYSNRPLSPVFLIRSPPATLKSSSRRVSLEEIRTEALAARPPGRKRPSP